MTTQVLEQAKALRGQGRWAESAAVLKPIVAAQPTNWSAVYYYAMALLESGQPALAKGHFQRMIAAGKHRAEANYMLARCCMEMSEASEARQYFQVAHDLRPTPMTLRSLSNIDWMEGDLDRFRDRLRGARGPLSVFAYGLWIESEDYGAAEAAWQALAQDYRTSAEALTLRAQHLRQTGDRRGSLDAARQAQLSEPYDAGVIDAVAAGCLMCGDGQGALEAIAPLRQSQPDNQHWIAHETTALRLLGDLRFEHLVDMDRHVRVYDLPVPYGYKSLPEFNAALLQDLNTHYPFARHPLNQSLRGGSQTAQDLLAMEGRAVRAYIQALKGPIAAYLQDIGTAPGHPLTGRNSGGFRIRGCWSVRLKAGGHHVNHVHPEGWISSAYYVSVPETELSRAGWIKFGEPPFETDPALSPLKWVQPKPGMLVLFPSYLWHGTEPIGQGATRVTAPFDVVPA
ncbi:MAG: putative 2OG-Fe(II) oxygenase [Pseudomonadota bacterium]